MKFHLSKNTKNILFVILALVVILAIVSYITPRDTNKSPHSIYDVLGVEDTASSYASFEGFKNKDTPKVMLFHATWCGHCEQYLNSGIYEKTAENPEVQGIPFEKFDADKNSSMVEKYDITGFPTILGLNAQGEKVVFEGNRNSMDDLIKFAKSLTQ
jgi:thiol-disulfide isomerase/thioredoxin